MSVYYAHATGFCGAVWRPVINQLPEVDSVAWDFAGHGSGPSVDLPIDWKVFGEQVLDETAPGGIGVGHSMGAAALLMAQLADPNRFRFLLLIEPVVFPGPHDRLDHPLAVITAKRKKTFESRAKALENFTSRDAFSNWHPDAMTGYVECGLSGEGPVQLACAPEVEADIYRASNAHDTYERLGDIEIPVLVMAGVDSDTITPDYARQQAAQMQRAGLEIVPDAGHFLPMEKPELIADRVRRLVRFET